VGPVEVCAYVAMLSLFLYARTRLPKGKRRWHGFAQADQGPRTAWGIVYSFSGIVFALWLLRIAHLLWFGPDR